MPSEQRTSSPRPPVAGAGTTAKATASTTTAKAASRPTATPQASKSALNTPLDTSAACSITTASRPWPCKPMPRAGSLKWQMPPPQAMAAASNTAGGKWGQIKIICSRLPRIRIQPFQYFKLHSCPRKPVMRWSLFSSLKLAPLLVPDCSHCSIQPSCPSRPFF